MYNGWAPVLRKLREQEGLTQSQVAEALKVKETNTIGRWENEDGYMPPGRVRSLSQLFRVPEPELWRRYSREMYRKLCHGVAEPGMANDRLALDAALDELELSTLPDPLRQNLRLQHHSLKAQIDSARHNSDHLSDQVTAFLDTVKILIGLYPQDS